MRTFLLVVVIAFILGSGNMAVCEEVDFEDEATQSQTLSGDSIYSYDEDNLPAVFFFPKDKARWDGSAVTMREWYVLTDLQKERFINEYLQQLQDQYNMSIDITGVDYLKALNVFSAYSNDRTLREPSTKFIDILLSGQGKLTGRDQLRDKNGSGAAR